MKKVKNHLKATAGFSRLSLASETPVGAGAHGQSPLPQQLERGERRRKKALWAAHVPENRDAGQDVFTAHPAREVKTGRSARVGESFSLQVGWQQNWPRARMSDMRSPRSSVSGSGHRLLTLDKRNEGYLRIHGAHSRETRRCGCDEVSSANAIGARCQDGVPVTVACSDSELFRERIKELLTDFLSARR